jgi:hypothetical protein
MMPICSCGAVIVVPLSATRPWLGASRPQIARNMVDLPQPEPPITTRISPGSTASERPSSARTPLG